MRPVYTPVGQEEPHGSPRPGRRPSLTAAAAFFDSFTLPRRVPNRSVADTGSEDGSPRLYRKSVNDEPGSELFPFWSTTISDLGCLGIGVAMYYRQLLVLSGLCFVYGLITLPTSVFYSSSGFSPTATEKLTTDTSLTHVLLLGSALCEDYRTVPLKSGGTAVFTSECDLKQWSGVLDLAALLLLFIALAVTFHLQDREAVRMDERTQTAQDFSIIVEDPTPDADDPDEWQEFFSQFGTVAYVTVARSNGPLLALLTRRRELQQQLERLHATDGHVEGGGGVLSLLRWLGLWRDEGYYMARLLDVEENTRKALEQQYPVCRVFVTFAKEESQRRALAALTTGLIPAALELSTIPPAHRFRGTNVLHVQEAEEPTDVAWEALHLPLGMLLAQRAVALAVTAGVVVASYFVIMHAQSISPAFASIIISVINSLLPAIMTMITNTESFYSNGDREASLMFKLVLARFMATAVISYMSTPFSDTLGSSALASVQAVLISDALVTPTIGLLDITGFIDRNILARFAPTQEAMNAKFLGTEWSLGERYTSMAKTLFVALFYSAVYPPGMFIAAVCFLYTYFVDKYCLLRLWRQPPQMDEGVAVHSRGFIIFAGLAHLFVTANWYASWAFDAAARAPEGGYEAVDKTLSRHAVGGVLWQVLKPSPEDWMPAEQTRLVKVYSLAAVLVLVTCLIIVFGRTWAYSITRLFFGINSAAGRPQTPPVWATHMDVYFPRGVQSRDPTLGPLLAAKVQGTFPKQHHPDLESFDLDEQNVVHDVPHDVAHAAAGAFSTLRCYSGPIDAGLYGSMHTIDI